VRTYDRRATHEHWHTREIDDWRNLSVIEMGLHQGELGSDHRHDGRANESGDAF